MEISCPNCGHQMVSYRTDRQSAGAREVVLKWMMCTHCRHVALANWSFTGPALCGGGQGPTRNPEARLP